MEISILSIDTWWINTNSGFCNCTTVHIDGVDVPSLNFVWWFMGGGDRQMKMLPTPPGITSSIVCSMHSGATHETRCCTEFVESYRSPRRWITWFWSNQKRALPVFHSASIYDTRRHGEYLKLGNSWSQIVIDRGNVIAAYRFTAEVVPDHKYTEASCEKEMSWAPSVSLKWIRWGLSHFQNNFTIEVF